MIRCIRIWTNENGGSSFEEGFLALPGGQSGDSIGQLYAASTIHFRETLPREALDWHDAPTHQLVLTLGGTLQFETRSGDTFVIRPGDVLLADDTTGTGHRWKVIGDEPWRRAYVVLAHDIDAGFTTQR